MKMECPICGVKLYTYIPGADEKKDELAKRLLGYHLEASCRCMEEVCRQFNEMLEEIESDFEGSNLSEVVTIDYIFDDEVDFLLSSDEEKRERIKEYVLDNNR